jgi:predicted porin
MSMPVSASGGFLAEVARSYIDMPGAPKVHRTTSSIGYDYRLSKRTDVYVVYSSDKRSNAGFASSAAVAVRHLF